MNVNYQINSIFSKMCSIDKAIIDVCQNKYKDFLSKANVVALGLGYKSINNSDTSKKCIKVFVTKKLPPTSISPKDMIPPKYNGLLTDVVDNGGDITPSSFNHKIRPVIGGYSIGPLDAPSCQGTVGGLVTDGVNIYFLSCNHVLADNRLPQDSSILQPGVPDGGTINDEVAKLSRFLPILFITPTQAPVNYVDCAIAKLNSPNIALPNIVSVGIPLGVALAFPNEPVIKVGRTSELTFGNILAIGATAIIGYPTGSALFHNLIITTKMSYSGDSGALLLNSYKYALGMIFASSDSVSYSNSIFEVLGRLNVALITM